MWPWNLANAALLQWTPLLFMTFLLRRKKKTLNIAIRVLCFIWTEDGSHTCRSEIFSWSNVGFSAGRMWAVINGTGCRINVEPTRSTHCQSFTGVTQRSSVSARRVTIRANSLEGFAGVFLLQLGGDGDPLVVHFPVKGPPHGVPRLRLVAEVVVVDHVDHGTHDGLPVLGDAVWEAESGWSVFTQLFILKYIYIYVFGLVSGILK